MEARSKERDGVETKVEGGTSEYRKRESKEVGWRAMVHCVL